MERKVYQAMAALLVAADNCAKAGNTEWWANHRASLAKLVSDAMPEGSGFDSGTKLDLDASRPDRLVFVTSFHHMNDGGMYDGWTDHCVIVTPSLMSGFDLRVTGRNRNGIKDYIAETFQFALSELHQEGGQS